MTERLIVAACRAAAVLVLLAGPALAPARGADAEVPRPESVLGFRPGDDYKLADYGQMLEYFRLVDEASERVRVEEIGESEMGRTMIMAIVTAPENFARLDRYREIARRLALARDLTDEQARALAREGKAVVYIDSGLHATEVAHAQHTFELVHRLATSDDETIRRILDEVVLLLFPCVNPDGLDIVVDWYRRNVGTPYEVSPLPRLYAKYVGHDNNRDWFMFTQAETRNVGRVIYQQWYPQIVYNHHQSGPFPARIFVPPFDDPMNPHIPPLVMRGVQLVGSAMAEAFAERGMPGVVSGIVYSTWWNGGLRTAPYFHNMIGILTETALYRYATPKFYTKEELPETFRRSTLSTTEPSTFYPHPWPGGWWRLRDAVDYMLVASEAVLDTAARYRESFLYNIYRMGRDAIGRDEPPYAFVVPAEQADPGTAAKLIDTLLFGGVEVHRATAPFTADGIDYPAESYVLLAAQPFRPYLMDLMTPQVHPDQREYPGGPPKPPYDIAGWTLPFSMGVRSVAVETPFDVPLRRIERAEPPPGGVEGAGSVVLLDPRLNDAVIAVNRLLAKGAAVYRTSEPAASLPAGAFVTTDGAVRSLAEELHLRARAVRRLGGRGLLLRAPRVGLYQSWVPSMDEGWTRWLFDRFEVPYRTVHDAEMRKPGLEQRYDVLVVPGESSLEELVSGHEPGTMPPEYVGGLGREGVARLRDFVRAGRTLVLLDSATALALEHFDVPVTNALAELDQAEFYCPGSQLEVELDPGHPLAFGMDRRAIVFFRRSPAFTLVPDFEERQARAVAKYPDRNPLVSGWIHGEERIRRKAALVEVPYGDGRIVLFGFRTQFRGQTHGTFKLLFNAVYWGASEPASLP